MIEDRGRRFSIFDFGFAIALLAFAGCARPALEIPDARAQHRARAQKERLAQAVDMTANEIPAAREAIGRDKPQEAIPYLNTASRATKISSRIVGLPIVPPPAATAPEPEKAAFLAATEKAAAEDAGEPVFAAEVYDLAKVKAAAEAAGLKKGKEEGAKEAMASLGTFARAGAWIDSMLRWVFWIAVGLGVLSIACYVLLGLSTFGIATGAAKIVLQILGFVKNALAAVFTLGASAAADIRAWNEARKDRQALEVTVAAVQEARKESGLEEALDPILKKHQSRVGAEARVRAVKGGLSK